jgi:hypothetical protein
MHRLIHCPLTVGLILLGARVACAVVTPLGYWRLGEDDLGASPIDPSNEFTIDALGGLNLKRQGTLEQNNDYYIRSEASPAALLNTSSSLATRAGIVWPHRFPDSPSRPAARYFRGAIRVVKEHGRSFCHGTHF